MVGIVETQMLVKLNFVFTVQNMTVILNKCLLKTTFCRKVSPKAVLFTQTFITYLFVDHH